MNNLKICKHCANIVAVNKLNTGLYSFSYDFLKLFYFAVLFPPKIKGKKQFIKSISLFNFTFYSCKIRFSRLYVGTWECHLSMYE